VDDSGRGEFAAIARLAARLRAAPPGELWIGDDAAVLSPLPGPVLVATDAVVAGVHADLSLVSLADLGWKAVVANISDLAAMGGRPVAAVVAVAGPGETDLEELYDGISAAAERWRCPVVGGDLSAASELVVTVTVVGDGSGTPPPVRRSGARPGDAVLVTGPLGASAAGLRALRSGERHGRAVDAHRRPQARLVEGGAARAAGATAMIDVSDGLAADLGHVVTASGVGLRLHDVPVVDGATLEEAVAGGEDYELVFTAPDPSRIVAAFARAGLRVPLVIGECTADPGERTLGGEPLPAGGWEHRWR
jgi:thiamine-monophosphate kinase